MKSRTYPARSFPVDRIDACGPHRNAHLTGARVQRLHLNDPQDFGATIFVEFNGFHIFSFF